MQVPVQVLHMNGGEGKNSYYRNSLFQKKVMLTGKRILKESIAELLCENSLSECLTMADLGCSSGPNTLIPLWEIIQTIDSTCTKLNRIKPPVLQYFLNDLLVNDYNTIFRSVVPDFHQKLQKEKGNKFDEHCFIAAIPGSFYGRLFPANSLHFVHSSSGLHWSSQVPEGLVSESGILLNKGNNICLNKSSPPTVQKAYLNQFDKDFTKLLRSRSWEVVAGGQMVLTFVAKSDRIPYCEYGGEIFDLIGNSLKEMVDEEMIKESTLDDFNIPFNPPSIEQVRNVIEKEGSFRVKGMEEFQLSWDSNIDDGENDLSFDLGERAKYVSDWMRAVLEPMLTTHFGDSIIDTLFYKFTPKVFHCLEEGIGFLNFVTLSIAK